MTIGVYNMTARDVMTRGADTVLITQSIHSALESLVQLGLSALPVVNEKQQCLGVLSTTDIIRLTGSLDDEDRAPQHQDFAALYFGVPLDELTHTKVEDVMTTRVISATPDEPLPEVAKKMLRHEVHHVPVCDADGTVVGMISSMDLVKAI
jgi:CBS domain-containing protein